MSSSTASIETPPIFLNGHKLGSQPYGYTSFQLDLTPELSFSGPNVLAVRVDNSAQPNSRWYSGSGIYRHVRVIITNPLHVAHWGVFVSTPNVSEKAATVQIHTTVANESVADAGLTLRTTLLDRTGQTVGNSETPVQLTHGQRAKGNRPGHCRYRTNPVVSRFTGFVSRCHPSA